MQGYRIEIFQQRNSKYAVMARKDSKEEVGFSIESINTKLLTAVLIKIKRKIDGNK